MSSSASVPLTTHVVIHLSMPSDTPVDSITNGNSRDRARERRGQAQGSGGGREREASTRLRGGLSRCTDLVNTSAGWLLRRNVSQQPMMENDFENDFAKRARMLYHVNVHNIERECKGRSHTLRRERFMVLLMDPVLSQVVE